MTGEDEEAEPRCVIECVFVLAGRDFDPDECIREIGLDGGEAWRQKRPKLAANPALSNAEVRYSEGPAPFDSLEEPLARLLERIAPAKDRIAACAKKRKLSPGVTCLVKVYTDRPLYLLSPESMRVMAELGAPFSMDLIDLRPDE